MDRPKLPNLFVSGQAGSGKDTVADLLIQIYGYKQERFAKGVYDIAYKHFNMKEKDRKLLQIIGNVARVIQPNYWIEQLLKRTGEKPDTPFIVTDCRFVNEYEALVAAGFQGIFVFADEKTRHERLQKRDGRVQLETLNDVSETEMLKFKHKIPILCNNGSWEELHQELKLVMNSILNK